MNIVLLYLMKFKYNKKYFFHNSDEFKSFTHDKYNYLKFKSHLGKLETEAGLLIDLSEMFNFDIKLISYSTSNSGFIPIKCSPFFNSIDIIHTPTYQIENLSNNINSFNCNNINILNRYIYSDNVNNDINIIYIDNKTNICKNLVNTIKKSKSFIFTDKHNQYVKPFFNYYNFIYFFNNNLSDKILLIPDSFHDIFIDNFKFFIDYSLENFNILNYDNLIHFTMIVKNAGPTFEDILLKNIHLFDRWTILDTGSTDGTQDIINKVLNNKKGKLYQEPFINFRESRNRCLDLAGHSCKFVIMLDDTYIINGDLRNFLNIVRDDIYADSFSLIIKSYDVEYSSNRIIKSDTDLRYKFTIHEVIDNENNINVIVPHTVSFIYDDKNEYMDKRTFDRKQLDLKLLYEMVEEEPENPRHLYYLAQTYNLLEDYEKTAEFFLKRVNHYNIGFIQEKIDACFELARLYNFKLNKPWNICEELYLKCFEMDKSRPDSLYFIGIHYYLDNDHKTAFYYFKQAFNIGYPIHAQYSLKPTLSFHFLPKFLAELCYEFDDFIIGEKCSLLFLNNNSNTDSSYDVMLSWYNIFLQLNKSIPPSKPIHNDKNIICFIADGGFSSWTGRDILDKGVGGSETHTIEMARYIKKIKSETFDVFVFCRCESEDIFEGVFYRPLDHIYKFLSENIIHTCIISRFSEYIPLTYKYYVENVFCVFHDLLPSGLIIPLNPRLKKIFCLTEWHVKFFIERFPILKDLTTHFHYGIDFDKFLNNNNIVKVPYRFIYSSFPNRGLLPLLMIWNKIIDKFPDAELHIFSDINGSWVQNNFKIEMDKLDKLIKDSKQVVYHGWVNKKDLADAWLAADIWFYPCKFKETFCLTALEAALTKTLAITNGLAALENTVSDRGITIPVLNEDINEVLTDEWLDKAFNSIVSILSNREEKELLVNKNYEWAINMSWYNRAKKFVENYIDPTIYQFEYLGMYNWTNNIPAYAADSFNFAINQITPFNNSINFLEIGTYTGMSLIGFIKFFISKFNFINIKADVIDYWSNYFEDDQEKFINELDVKGAFHRNIDRYNFNQYINNIYIGKSQDILFDMLNNFSNYYDFIYIDGSHTLIDSYMDLFLSWKLLKVNGILGIDDYLFNVNDSLNSPHHAINKFIKNIDNQYKLISKDYRVFLQKI